MENHNETLSKLADNRTTDISEMFSEITRAITVLSSEFYMADKWLNEMVLNGIENIHSETREILWNIRTYITDNYQLELE